RGYEQSRCSRRAMCADCGHRPVVPTDEAGRPRLWARIRPFVRHQLQLRSIVTHHGARTDIAFAAMLTVFRGRSPGIDAMHGGVAVSIPGGGCPTGAALFDHVIAELVRPRGAP